MSFIGGIIQSLLTDIAKEELLKKRKPISNKQSWGCAGLILISFFGVLFLFHLMATSSSKSTTDINILKVIKVGDSLFVKDDNGIDFYKKGDIKLSEWEQREVKYAFETRKGFIEINNVNDKFFFKNRTSFIGTCAGIDSTDGNKWLMIIPSNAVTHPPKRKDIYDYRTRTWENKKYDILNDCKLSKEFYVRVSDVVIKNNDKIFK